MKRATRPMTAARALAIAALVAAPGLFAGFLVDDFMHLLTLRGVETVAAPFDLFRFAPGDAGELYPFLSQGPLPWYSLPDLKLHFFRPLSSAAMVLDHLLFGDFAFAYHLHSTLWYMLLTGAVLLLFRRAMAPGLAGLCCLLYILDDGHLIPALWWSNRNAIVAAAPALLGLVAHLRWRQEGWRPGLPLSLAGYGLGLLGGETALGIFGYLIAWELLRREDPWADRVRALAPAGLLAVGYLVAYKLGGFGVYGSGVYIDPIADWDSYLRALPARLAELLGAQFFSVPVELAVISDGVRAPLLTTSIAAAALVAAGGLALWRACAPEERHLLMWMGLGSFIASLPVLATFPSGRLLLLPSVGGAVWIGLFIAKGAGAVRGARPRLLRALGRFFLALHLAAMPLYWVAVSIAVPAALHAANRTFDQIELDPETVEGQQVFLLFTPEPYSGLYPVIVRTYLGHPRPESWQTLSLAPHDHAVIRTGPDTFDLFVLGGEMLSTPFERLIRSEKFPLRPGDIVALDGYTIAVKETGPQGPSHISVRLEHPLDDPRYRFFAWQGGHLAPMEWPPVGTRQVYSAGEGYFSWPYFKKRLPLL